MLLPAAAAIDVAAAVRIVIVGGVGRAPVSGLASVGVVHRTAALMPIALRPRGRRTGAVVRTAAGRRTGHRVGGRTLALVRTRGSVGEHARRRTGPRQRPAIAARPRRPGQNYKRHSIRLRPLNVADPAPLICLNPRTSCLDLGDFGVERPVVFAGAHLVLGLFGACDQPLDKAYGRNHRDAITNL